MPPPKQSSRPGALVSTLSLRPLLVELRHRNLPSESILGARGIAPSDVTEPLTRVPEAVLWEIWADAVRIANDPALGIVVGCHFEPQSLGILGHVVANSATIADSLTKWQEFTALIDDQPFIHVIPNDHCVRLEFRRRPDIDPEENRSLVEFAAFSVLKLLGYLSGTSELLCEPVQRMCFRHAKPPADQLHAYRERVGKTELCFDQVANAIELDSAVLTQPVAYADTQMLELMSERARQQLRDQHRGHFVVLRVQQALRKRLGTGSAKLEVIAEDLAMSRSTLQRQLSEAGVSFRSLLEEIRKDRAFELLRNPAEAVESIALALGYAEPAAFIHAFKRWTEQTPTAWRTGQTHTM